MFHSILTLESAEAGVGIVEYISQTRERSIILTRFLIASVCKPRNILLQLWANQFFMNFILCATHTKKKPRQNSEVNAYLHQRKALM